MRAYPLILLVILGGCSFGEAAGFYDLPELSATADTGTSYPALVPLAELEREAFNTVDAEAELATLAARASAQRALSAATETSQIEEDTSATASGNALLDRVEASRTRGGL